MPSRSDLLEAKKTLSAQLLQAGIREGVLAMAATRSIDRAIMRTAANVHAVGIGRKLVNGKPAAELCVRIHVVQKIANPLIPPAYRLPATFDGIPTDVIESPPAFIFGAMRRAVKRPHRSPIHAATAAASRMSCTADRRKQQRPVIGGISTGHFKITAGTIAYFCRSTRAGENADDVFVLSNNHVLANLNLAKEGDDIHQPGPADGGTSVGRIASLKRWVPIDLNGKTPNLVDAAIASLSSGITWSPEICSIGRVAGTAKGVEGMIVCKHGRTTGYTEGEVTDESYDAVVGMDHSNSSILGLFQNQMRIERTSPYAQFGNGGDSGSLVVNKNKAAVGLYFAGPSNGQYGVANQFDDVARLLEIQLL